MARDLAIDLGTSTISILARGEGVILSEPSVLARVAGTGEVVAVGEEAARMMGRTPDGLEAMRPLRGGAITDFESAEGMIRSFLHRVGVRRMNRPRIVVCVPSSITPVEQRAVREAAHRTGAAEVQLLGYTMAAALGCGLPLDQPVGSMVVDIGAGTTEAAVVSLGGVVAVESRRLGGLDLDLDLQGYVRRRHGVEISLATAEQVKLAIGAARDPIMVDPDGGPERLVVRGRRRESGAVEEVSLSALEVADAIHDKVMIIVDTVLACLGWAPPEIANDLIDNGINLVGGGAMLEGMDERLAAGAKVPVRVVEDARQVTVRGAGRCLGLFHELDGFFLTDHAGTFR
ncbi:MAG: rod shape-determining protein [Actinomycetota bacterium]